MGSFFTDNAYPKDFNLGGFQPVPPGAPNDPRLSTDMGMKDPTKPLPTELPADAQMGFTSGTIGNGGGTQGPMRMGDVFGMKGGNSPQQTMSGSTSMPQVFAPSYAAQMGPNGPQFNYGNGNVQPANPGQQNQTLMRSPDGQHFQYVNQEHVPHYQGLGAQVYNGSSYGGGNG